MADTPDEEAGETHGLFARAESAGEHVGRALTELAARLREAVVAADVGEVRSLIRRGADPNGSDERGITVLAHAIATGCVDLIRALIEAGANVNQESRPATEEPVPGESALPLLIAALARRRKVCELLAPLTQPKLRKAVVKQFRAVKKKWNKKLARDPRVKALLSAAEHGDARTVAKTIADGADVRAGDEFYGNTALTMAALGGHTDVVQLLLETGADPDNELDTATTPLMVAQNAAVAELLIRAGADPNRTIDGCTPLNTAAVWNRHEVAAVLLRSGANPNAPADPHGCALSNAIAKGSFDVARLLIESGASVNLCPKKGWPPLMNAASWGHEVIIPALLAAGADVHFRDPDGDTPLSVAAEYPRVVALLRQAGAET